MKVEYRLSQKLVAELLATFALVALGCGSAIIAGSHIGYVGIALTFGFAQLSMVYAIGGISGCHLNPMVTICMLYMRKIGSRDAVFYIITQVVAAILGISLLYAVLLGNSEYNLAVDGLWANGYGDYSPEGYNMTSAILAETILAMFFILTTLGATSKSANKKFSGLAIGSAMIMIQLLAIPITRVSINPARSIGPAFVEWIAGGESGALSQLWLFILVPIVGGLLGAIAYKYLIQSDEEREESKRR